MTAVGVRAGANMPYQPPSSTTPSTPASAMVGTSGSAAQRFPPAKAIGRSLPARMCGIESGGVTNIIWMCPPIRSEMAGPAPLYGACATLMPAREVNSSVARCSALPKPGVP